MYRRREEKQVLGGEYAGIGGVAPSVHPSSQFEVPNVPRGTRELVR